MVLINLEFNKITDAAHALLRKVVNDNKWTCGSKVAGKLEDKKSDCSGNCSECPIDKERKGKRFVDF